MANHCYGSHGGDCYGATPVVPALQQPHYQTCTPILPHYANLPVFTDHYSPKDQCQILTLVAGAGPIAIDIPLDPNTSDRAQWAGFSSLDGDYVVSLSGGVLSVDSGAISNTTPIFSPEKIPLTGAFKLYLWSKNGATVRVCWYRAEPCNNQLSKGGERLTILLEMILAKISAIAANPRPGALTINKVSGSYVIPANARHISISSADLSPYKVDGETLPGDYIVSLPYTDDTYSSITVDGNLIVQEIR